MPKEITTLPMIPLNKDKIQQARTPTAFASWIKEIRLAVHNNSEELSKARRKQGYYKEFLDELTPLSEFCVRRFTDDYLVTPVLGNQSYDAVVTAKDKSENFLIEITMPHNGAEIAKEQALAREKGIGTLHRYGPGEEVLANRKFVDDTAQKKSAKNYEHCLLVFALAASTIPFGDDCEILRKAHVLAEDEIIKDIAKKNYKAKEVWVICAENRFVKIFPCELNPKENPKTATPSNH